MELKLIVNYRKKINDLKRRIDTASILWKCESDPGIKARRLSEIVQLKKIFGELLDEAYTNRKSTFEEE